ncbi:MAG: hypothetical protein L0K86_07085 [Actinomycetia bacterium]|nr:hypothetical protein [Actinomycetes bacterium]
MSNHGLARLHLVAALIGFAVILTFWLGSAIVELFGSHEAVMTVKQTIPWGLLLLVPALATTGATGYRMSRGTTDPTVRTKLRRMQAIAAIGLLVLVPCVLYLGAVADRGLFDRSFWTVQTIELVAGAANVALMSANLRDGLRLTGRITASR